MESNQLQTAVFISLTAFVGVSRCVSMSQEVVLSPTASSYSMAQLTGSTEYNVRLQAIAGAQRSRHISTTFTTGKSEFREELSFLVWLEVWRQVAGKQLSATCKLLLFF